MTDQERNILSKVPAATAGFWIVKILATTLGEVGGNLVSMNMGLGYLAATLILASIFIALAATQILARRFRPSLYWLTIVASTTAGTTLADFTTRSLGIGYTGGSILLLALVIASLITWRLALGKLSADKIADRRTELFYWITITFSQTLGTALGDWFADTAGLGYWGSALVISAILLVILVLHWRRAVDGVLLFWAAFVLTRPLGAVLGNFLDKPDHGGLALNRPVIVTVLAGLMIVVLIVMPQKAGHHQTSQL
ncbi:COG4705 family protein [Hyphococcus sp.]|uniref:COG4705 family protein n=1 Tax=Hyphococcus sp. TaxID=2038636 RepID=UPI0037509241